MKKIKAVLAAVICCALLSACTQQTQTDPSTTPEASGSIVNTGINDVKELSAEDLPEALRPASRIAVSLTAAGCHNFVTGGSLSAEEALIFYWAFYSVLDEDEAEKFMDSYADDFDGFVNRMLGRNEIRDYSVIPSGPGDGGEMFYYAEDGGMVCAYLPNSPTMSHAVTGFGGDESGRGEYAVEITSYFDIDEAHDVGGVIAWRFEGTGSDMRVLGVGDPASTKNSPGYDRDDSQAPADLE